MFRRSQTRYYGAICLGVWLILQGAIPLLSIGSQAVSLISAVLAIVAGVLILMDR